MRAKDIPQHLLPELAAFAGTGGIAFVFDTLVKEIEMQQCGMSLNQNPADFRTAYARLADKKVIINELRDLLTDIKEEFENETL